MSDIIKKAFENIDPEAEKRLDEKLKNGSELFGLYDVIVSKGTVCECDNPHCQDGTVEVIYGEPLRCSNCDK